MAGACALASAFRRCVVQRATKSHALRTWASSTHQHPDPRHTNVQNSPPGFDAASAAVYPDFLTEEEGKALVREASKRLKRRRFENGHWDSVIVKYREVELSTPEEEYSQTHGPGNGDDTNPSLFAEVIERTRRHIASHHLDYDSVRWLPCHTIDLSADGELSAHVDSVKFSGDVVAGLSLLSDSIMRLRPSSEEWDSDIQPATPDDAGAEQLEGHVDLYLPQLSLYVLSKLARYSYTHELLPSNASFDLLERSSEQHGNEVKRIKVIRGRRLSIIFRDAHRDSKS